MKLQVSVSIQYHKIANKHLQNKLLQEGRLLKYCSYKEVKLCLQDEKSTDTTTTSVKTREKNYRETAELV